MGEQLTVEIEQSLKEVLLRYCEASNESPDSVINRAVAEFMTKEKRTGDNTWFGLPSEDYFSLSEEERESLWNKAYGAELGKTDPAERNVQISALTPRQRGRETLRRRIREIRKKPAAHR